MDVEVAVNRRNRLFVQIHADAGLGAGMIAVSAAGDAAHINMLNARVADFLEGDTRQILGVIVETTDIQLFKPRRVESLNTEGNILQIFRALLRGYRDFLQYRGFPGVG